MPAPALTECPAPRLPVLEGRDAFFECATPAFAGEGMVAVIVVQLQRLRQINLELGYDVGDQVIDLAAQRIASCLRPQDRIARIAQSEFALLLPALRSSGQPRLAVAKIQRMCAEPVDLVADGLRLQLVFGVSLFPSHAREPQVLLRLADRALEEARQSGIDLVVHDHTDADDATPLGMERELERAVGNNGLELAFQPKVNLLTGGFSGVEALSRWHSTRFGVVSPDAFIEIAERSGLIVPLTLWSLHAALREARDWADQVPGSGVAVNLSPRLLAEPELPALVSQAVQIWDFDAERLTLEVTEGALMRDPQMARNRLAAIHDLGIRISIDDFGTGYSSLAYLKNLPVDELKIDKSFVMNMASDANDRRIVQAVTDLAGNFELSVVAEGVEDDCTLGMLVDLGCSHVQGYHIGRPMSAVDLQSWLARAPTPGATARRPSQGNRPGA